MTDALHDRLAREAGGMQPAFSEALHQRVMAGMPHASPTVWQLRPVHLGWAAIAVGTGFIALWAVRPTQPRPTPVQDAFPRLTLRVRTPNMPDLPREVIRVLRRAPVAFLRGLEDAPLPISLAAAPARPAPRSIPSPAGDGD
jgi:hypothetical protein